MEHSALHAAQLIGTLIALAAALLALAVLRPALRRVERMDAATQGDARGLAQDLAASLATWAWRGSLLAAAASLANLVVQIGEIENTTILAGADPALLRRFAIATTVGRITLARAGLLFVSAALAWRMRTLRRLVDAQAEWLALLATTTAAVVAMTLVSHAAALPSGRAPAIAVQMAHLVAAGAWIGSLAHLLAARALVRSARTRSEIALVADVVRRFSPIALAAAAVLVGSGAFAAWSNLGTPVAIVTSAYGLTLLVKLTLLATLLVPAWVNYRVVRPALARAAESEAAAAAAPAVLARFGSMLELEVTAGLLVIAVAGILGSVSPPLADGTGRLAPPEARALATPRLPQTDVVDPSTWVGSETRTDDDLRYSEFMHNWSGLIVVLLGVAWLVQAAGGPRGARVGRLWPLALLPFAAFVAIASDPEVWPMGTVDPIRALADPIVLEHRIGALMIVALAWLGLREERRGGDDRPLGRALPILMIVGSFLLLGHAHSSFGATESLTTMINVQHAIMGGLGLLAGVVRWLELRGLFPRPAARVLWPSLVIAVGLSMAFFYRELVVA
ncbi:MAG TPA: CopD family protein [Candidatus Binatia bacterium]|nr:CopD family protein [Candidatus Binatia bacterium]